MAGWAMVTCAICGKEVKRHSNSTYCLDCAHNPKAARLAMENGRLRDALKLLLRVYRNEVRSTYRRVGAKVYRAALRNNDVHQAARCALRQTLSPVEGE